RVVSPSARVPEILRIVWAPRCSSLSFIGVGSRGADLRVALADEDAAVRQDLSSRGHPPLEAHDRSEPVGEPDLDLKRLSGARRPLEAHVLDPSEETPASELGVFAFEK